MNLKELSLIYPISEDTFRAVDKVEKLTGKSIRFILEENLMSHAVLKAARNFMSEHIIIIKRSNVSFINHLIIHECHHIFRFWSVEQNERKILSIRENTVIRYTDRWKRELGKKGEMYPPHVFQIWEKGLFTLFY